MFDQNTNADDSTGATDAEVTQEQIEGVDQSATTDQATDLPDEKFYDIDGEEVSENQIKAWKTGHMKDADYTQKTQKHSAEVKAFAEQKSKFGESIEALSALENEIADMVMGDLKGIDMDALRVEDPSEYLRIKELKDSRGKWREGLSARLNEMSGKVIEDAQKVLFDQHGWNDGEKLKADTTAIMDYVKDSGLDQREFAKITNPHVMTAILEAAKYRKLMAEKPAITKRVVEAPKTSKPAKSNTKPPKSLADRMFGTKS